MKWDLLDFVLVSQQLHYWGDLFVALGWTALVMLLCQRDWPMRRLAAVGRMALTNYLLQTVIIRAQGSGSTLARALGSDIKGKLSPPLYLAGVLLAFVDTRISDAIYVLVALMWLVPDRRIERTVQRS